MPEPSVPREAAPGALERPQAGFATQDTRGAEKGAPDELVAAAAGALQDDDAWYEFNQQTGEVVGVALTTVATIALQAAFAKLAECFEVQQVAMKAIDAVMCDLGAVIHNPVQGVAAHKVFARAVTEALAREFGGQE